MDFRNNWDLVEALTNQFSLKMAEKGSNSIPLPTFEFYTGQPY